MKQRTLVYVAVVANFIGVMVLGAIVLARYESAKAASEMCDREQPYLEYLNIPFPTLDSAVDPGQPIRYLVKRRSSAEDLRLYPVAANLVSDGGLAPPMILHTSFAQVMPGDTEWISSVSIVPKTAPPGMYHVEGVAQIDGICRTFLLHWQSQSFTVRAKLPY